MPLKRALKSELASAALAVGIFAAVPSFADDSAGNAQLAALDTGVAQSEVTSATIQNIDPYNPLVPEGVLWGLMALIALQGAYRTANKKDGALSRTLAMAAGATLLVNPEIVNQEQLAEPTEYLILVDRSESQGFDDRNILTSDAYAQLSAQLENLGHPVNIRTVEFAGSDSENSRDGTSLASVLYGQVNAIPDSRLGGVFVLSDGRIHDGEALASLPDISVPVHALISGQENEVDFSLEIESIPRFGLVDEDAGDATLRVNADGALQSDYTFAVQMSNNGEYVASYTLNANQSTSIDLPSLSVGENNVEFTIAEIRNAQNITATDIEEVTEVNNTITASVQGIEDNPKVLLLSGAPHQGTTLWRELLGNDAGIDFVHFAHLRAPVDEDATPLRDLATSAFPIHEVLNESIDEYDVIIFDGHAYAGGIPFSYMERINEFVRNGGGLIVVGSNELTAAKSLAKTPLSEILPFTPLDGVFESGFIPQVTERGTHHPLGRILERSRGSPDNWGAWYSIANIQASAGADVLMSDSAGHPLLTISEEGEGRVAVLSSDQSWLWARGHGGGGPASELNRNLVRWVNGDPALDDENVTLRHDGEELVVDLQTMDDQEEDLIVTTPSGETITVTPLEIMPGLRRAFVPATEAGIYKVERGGDHVDRAFADVGFTDAREMANVVSSVDIVEPLTKSNGGTTMRMTGSDGALSIPDLQILRGGERAEPGRLGVQVNDNFQVIGTEERQPLIPNWLALALSLGLFGYGLKREGGKTWKQSLSWTKGRNLDSEPPAPGV